MSKTNNQRLQAIASAMQELNARLVYVGVPTYVQQRNFVEVLLAEHSR